METSSVEDGEMNIWRYIINIEIFDNWKITFPKGFCINLRKALCLSRELITGTFEKITTRNNV